MSLLKCPECGNQVSDRAEACPECGCPVSEIIQEKGRGEIRFELIEDGSIYFYFSEIDVIYVKFMSMVWEIGNQYARQFIVYGNKCIDGYFETHENPFSNSNELNVFFQSVIIEKKNSFIEEWLHTVEVVSMEKYSLEIDKKIFYENFEKFEKNSKNYYADGLLAALCFSYSEEVPSHETIRDTLKKIIDYEAAELYALMEETWKYVYLLCVEKGLYDRTYLTFWNMTECRFFLNSYNTVCKSAYAEIVCFTLALQHAPSYIALYHIYKYMGKEFRSNLLELAELAGINNRVKEVYDEYGLDNN